MTDKVTTLSNEDFRDALIALTSEDINERIEAIQKLGFSKRISAIKPLKRMYRDGGNILKSYARNALKRLEEDLNLDRIALMDEISEADSKTETSEDKPKQLNIEKLKAKISDNDPRIRIGSIQAATQFNCTEALPFILERLSQEYHLFVIASLLIGIGKLGSAEQQEVIYPFLTHDDERIRANALEALITIDSNSIDLKYVIPLLSDSSERVANNAARLVSQYDASTVKSQMTELRDSGVTDEQTQQSLETLRGVHPPKNTSQSTQKSVQVQKKSSLFWAIPLAVVLALLTGWFLLKKIPQNRRVNTAQTNDSAETVLSAEEQFKQGLTELEKYLEENQDELAAIQLRKLKKEFPNKTILKLYAADLLLRKKDFFKANELLLNFSVPENKITHLLYLRSLLQIGFKNVTSALRELEELIQQPEDSYTKKGKILEEKIRSHLDQQNNRILSESQKKLTRFYQSYNSEALDETETFFESKKTWSNFRAEFTTNYPELKESYLQLVTAEIKIERQRDGMKVTAEVLELFHGVLAGNSPVFIPMHKLLIFSPDPPYKILNIYYLSKQKDVIHPLITVAHMIRLMMKNIDKAQERLEKLYVDQKDNGHLIYPLVVIYNSLGKSDALINVVSDKISSLKFQYPFRFGVGMIQAEISDFLANAWLRKKNHEKFLTTLQTGLQFYAGNCPILLQLMSNARKNQDLNKFVALEKEIMKYEPDYAYVDSFFYQKYFQKIVAARKLIAESNFRDAMQLLTTLKQEQPNYWRISANIGEIFYRLERFGQAISQFEEALLANPFNTTLSLKLAKALHKNEENSEAKIVLEKAIKRHPTTELKNALNLLKSGKKLE